MSDRYNICSSSNEITCDNLKVSRLDLVYELNKIEKLEQQLSNSTPNAAIRELIEEYETELEVMRMEAGSYLNADSEKVADLILSKLNKLLTNKEEG